ncbi:hypothetical protein [Arthrobacter sp. RCC_34]|uniref:hypothetical protein n=1 Tax=Arthrobacter sp. RCC_34 TaxID=3239230 RepID=UPI003524192A
MTRAIGPVTTASTAGAALAVILIWGFETATHIDIPDLVEGAITVLCTAVSGAVVPTRGRHAAGGGEDG